MEEYLRVLHPAMERYHNDTRFHALVKESVDLVLRASIRGTDHEALSPHESDIERIATTACVLLLYRTYGNRPVPSDHELRVMASIAEYRTFLEEALLASFAALKEEQ